MILRDKFGNTISSSTFRILKNFVERLEEMGYIEGESNPNLFHYKAGDVTFYADFRGTKEVPIQIEPKPLIYWYPKKADENSWLSILSHFELLSAKGIPHRISFYEESELGGLPFDMKEFIDEYLSKKFDIPIFIFKTGILSFTDQEGKCHNGQCSRRFNAPGFFCSDRCKKVYIKRILVSEINTSKKFCALCGVIILGE